MKEDCQTLSERVKQLDIEEMISAKTDLLNEFHSKKYYDELKYLLQKLNDEMISIEEEANENGCESVLKELSELKEKLEIAVEDANRALEGHEKIIESELESYASALEQVVHAVLTGKVEEKKESKGIIDKLLSLLSPKPRDVKSISRKISKKIYDSDVKRLDEVLKNVDLDDREEVRKAVEELEKIEFYPSDDELTEEYLRREFRKELWRSFIPDEKKVKKLIPQLASYRAHIEAIGGGPTVVEKKFHVEGLEEFITGKKSFEEFAEPYFSEYVRMVYEEVKDRLKDEREKFEKKKDDLLRDLKDYL